MHHAVFGDSSFATNSSSDAAPVAPSATSCCDGCVIRVEHDRVCPPRISRRTMFPPIRPSPIIPICIEDLLLNLSE